MAGGVVVGVGPWRGVVLWRVLGLEVFRVLSGPVKLYVSEVSSRDGENIFDVIRLVSRSSEV